ncbi:DNA polymerase II [Thalassotalea agarivorans]|nr:DNA polymerase II [Thalassotalea agarivorans]
MSYLPISGVILTKHARDTRQGIELSYWVKSHDQVYHVCVPEQEAIFFIESHQLAQVKKALSSQNVINYRASGLALKTFNQTPVHGVYFKYLRDFYSARDVLKAQGIKCYEDDIRCEERFLMERFITSQVSFVGELKQLNGYTKVEHAKCKPADKDFTLPDINMVSVDIECDVSGQLYSIGLYSDSFQCVYMIGNGDLPEHQKAPAFIEWCDNEKALLSAFIDYLSDEDPDILIGWNVVGFDMQVLQKRYDFNDIPFSINRDGSVGRWRKNANSEQKFFDIAGRVVLDGIDGLKTATYSFPSFSLENVSNTLLGIGKKVEDADNRLQEIIDNFHHNKIALAEYNLEDCRLVWLIFEKTQLLSFSLLRAQLTGLAIDRIGGSVAAFTNLYLPKLHRAGYIAPNLGDGHSDLVSPGGYVMDSIPGLYKNVLVLDFKSLYPSIIRTFNIDPMGMVEGALSPDSAIEAFDGAMFSRDKHFLPAIIQSLWAERDIAKKQNDGALSQAIKIIMNSFYGVLGSNGCRFFDPRLSGAITKRGHEILKTTKQWIQDKGYTVIYGDTDSIFVHIGDEADSKQAKDIGLTLQGYINEQWRGDLKQRFAIDSALEIEFETHFTTFLMPTVRGTDIGTKKRYAGLVTRKGKEELVFKGLENVRTDWTQLAKDFQYELYHRVFHQQAVDQFVLETVEKTMAGELDDKLVYRKRLRRKLSHYVKNVPPHVKAARWADAINEKEGKSLQYQNRGWIEYVLTVNGPQTLKYRNAPIDYTLYIERQLKAVADGILPFIGKSFDEITDNQLKLFS